MIKHGGLGVPSNRTPTRPTPCLVMIALDTTLFPALADLLDEQPEECSHQGPVRPAGHVQHRLSMTARSVVASLDKIHPQYAMVLAVCSAALWVKPYLLHGEVSLLEKDLAAAEAEASFEFDLSKQAVK